MKKFYVGSLEIVELKERGVVYGLAIKINFCKFITN